MARKFTNAAIEKAIEGSGGVIGKIAKKLGSNYNTVNRYLKKHTQFDELIKIEQDRVVDKAEDNIIKSIEKGHIGNSKWFLQLVAERYQPSANIGGDMSITLKINGVDKDIFE